LYAACEILPPCSLFEREQGAGLRARPLYYGPCKTYYNFSGKIFATKPNDPVASLDVGAVLYEINYKVKRGRALKIAEVGVTGQRTQKKGHRPKPVPRVFWIDLAAYRWLG
jgi:hypothetical protein